MAVTVGASRFIRRHGETSFKLDRTILTEHNVQKLGMNSSAEMSRKEQTRAPPRSATPRRSFAARPTGDSRRNGRADAVPAQDRRIGRTRQALHRAMIELVLEKGFEATTIMDVVERANVGRSTFYTHYASKVDLLTAEMAELRAELKRLQREALGRKGDIAERRLGFSRALFEHAQDYRDIYRALLGERGSVVIMSRMRGLLSELVRQELPAWVPANGAPLVLRSAAVEFLVGALMAMLAWQAERKTGPSPAEVDRMFRALAIPAIAAALAPLPQGEGRG
jgi:AcrR family transcriptional regulator